MLLILMIYCPHFEPNSVTTIGSFIIWKIFFVFTDDRFISSEHMNDGIRQSNVESPSENLVNLNLISYVNLSSRGMAVAPL